MKITEKTQKQLNIFNKYSRILDFLIKNNNMMFLYLLREQCLKRDFTTQNGFNVMIKELQEHKLIKLINYKTTKYKVVILRKKALGIFYNSKGYSPKYDEDKLLLNTYCLFNGLGEINTINQSLFEFYCNIYTKNTNFLAEFNAIKENYFNFTNSKIKTFRNLKVMKVNCINFSKLEFCYCINNMDFNLYRMCNAIKELYFWLNLNGFIKTQQRLTFNIFCKNNLVADAVRKTLYKNKRDKVTKQTDMYKSFIGRNLYSGNSWALLYLDINIISFNLPV